MAQTFVYNSGKSEVSKHEIQIECGIFFDGTLNSKYNTLLREMVKEGVPRNATDEEKTAYYKGSKRSFIDQQGVDNSYSNDYTNVARLWEYCSPDYRIYIEGIGTVLSKMSEKLERQMSTGDQDDNDGFMFGSGKAGIRAKVRKACKILAERIKNEKRKYPLELKNIKVTLDVFGFSRGAAAARSFVHEVNVMKSYIPKGYIETTAKRSYDDNQKKKLVIERELERKGGLVIKQDALQVKPVQFHQADIVDHDGEIVSEKLLTNGRLPKMGHLGHMLLQYGLSYEEVENIDLNVEFVGVYDTVSSYYKEASTPQFVKDQLFGSPEGNKHFANDVDELGLNKIGKVGKAVHFTAMDEHRYNFALTRLPGAVEKQFPGVHCDIGGAYLNELEKVDEIEVGFEPSNSIVKKDVQMSIYSLKRGFWSKDAKERLQQYARTLIEANWFKREQLSINDVNSFKNGNKVYNISGLYDKLSSNRYLRKEYSYIPLLFMGQYFEKQLGNKRLQKCFAQKDKFNQKFSVDQFDVLKQAKGYLTPYVMNNTGGPWLYIDSEHMKIKDEIVTKKIQRLKAKIDENVEKEKTKFVNKNYTFEKHDMIPFKKDGILAKIEDDKRRIDMEAKALLDKRGAEIEERNIRIKNAQGVLEILRNEYFHWSANKDWFGMNPTQNRKRKMY